jgi:hypothetical protein
MHDTSSTEIVRPSRVFFDEGRLAIAGYLARYSGGTRLAYSSDLRAFFAWCDTHHLAAFEVQRPHLELWAREMEEVRPLHGGRLLPLRRDRRQHRALPG